MKMMSAIVGVVCFAGLVAACASDRETPRPPKAMTERVSASAAVDRVAEAACERQQRCEHIGPTEKYQNANHCLLTEKETIGRELANDSDCKNGVSTRDLDQCISQIQSESCSGVGMAFDEMRKSMKCGSNDMCLD